MKERIKELEEQLEQAEVRVQSLEATLAECNEQVYAAERDCVEAQDEVARLKSGTPHPGDGSCRLCGEAPADPHGICDTCRNLPAEVETLKALREEGRATEKRLMEIIQSAGYAHRKGWWDNAYSILKVHDGKHLDRLVQKARNAERQLADMSLETYRDKMDEMRAKLKESEQKKKMFNKVGMDMQSEAVGAQLECCSLRNDVGRLERQLRKTGEAGIEMGEIVKEMASVLTDGRVQLEAAVELLADEDEDDVLEAQNVLAQMRTVIDKVKELDEVEDTCKTKRPWERGPLNAYCKTNSTHRLFQRIENGRQVLVAGDVNDKWESLFRCAPTMYEELENILHRLDPEQQDRINILLKEAGGEQ